MKKIRIITIITTILCMGIIFMLSSDTSIESAQLSSSVSEIIINIFYKVIHILTGKELNIVLSSSNLLLLEHFFRKLAHMFIYMVLSINVMFVLFTYRKKMIVRLLMTFVFCFSYACSDEVHQIFVAGRGPQLIDVFFDSMGIAAGIILALVIYCIIYTIYHTYKENE